MKTWIRNNSTKRSSEIRKKAFTNLDTSTTNLGRRKFVKASDYSPLRQQRTPIYEVKQAQMFDLASPSRGSLAYVNDMDYGIQSSSIKRNSTKKVRTSSAYRKDDPRAAINIMDSKASFGNKMKDNKNIVMGERTFSFNDGPPGI